MSLLLTEIDDFLSQISLAPTEFPTMSDVQKEVSDGTRSIQKGDRMNFSGKVQEFLWKFCKIFQNFMRYFFERFQEKCFISLSRDF